jgi:hypothetical protein
MRLNVETSRAHADDPCGTLVDLNVVTLIPTKDMKKQLQKIADTRCYL